MVRPRLHLVLCSRAGSRSTLVATAPSSGSPFSGRCSFAADARWAPRSQMDECQQLSRTLRSENARLKDQLLVLKARTATLPIARSTMPRRLATQDEAIERLERSVQAYQDERSSAGIGLPAACLEPRRFRGSAGRTHRARPLRPSTADEQAVDLRRSASERRRSQRSEIRQALDE